MKKTSLLVLSFLAALGTSNAEKYDIIKDGKLVNGAIMPYEDADEGDYDTLTEGEEFATFQHNAQYQDVRIDFTEAAAKPDLSKTWYLRMEYMLEDEAVAENGDSYSLVADKKPPFILGLYGEMPKNLDITKADASISIDAKWGAAGVWRTANQYIYSASSLSTIDVLILSYIREYNDNDAAPCKIKNLWLDDADEGTKPFYAENFDLVNGKAAVYSDATITAKKYNATMFAGGIFPNSLDSDGDFSSYSLHRMWEGNGADAAGFFLDAENYHGLLVEQERAENIVIEGIKLPESHSGKMFASAVVKQVWSEDEADFGSIEDPALRPLNIYYKFDNGEEAALFADSALQGMWQIEQAEITIPDGAQSVDIIFKGGDWTYIVDNLKLSTLNNVEAKEVAAQAAAVVFPNPATDVISAANAEKIEVIALNGVVVASANGNSVSVSSLAAGAYIVKVTSAEGVSFSTIIKK